jgi:Ca2+-binding RTX toxin-like protein
MGQSDSVSGDSGNDFFQGGYHDQTQWGAEGADLLYGAGGVDTISGNGGDDRMFGGGHGNDNLFDNLHLSNRLVGNGGGDSCNAQSWDTLTSTWQANIAVACESVK